MTTTDATALRDLREALDAARILGDADALRMLAAAARAAGRHKLAAVVAAEAADMDRDA